MSNKTIVIGAGASGIMSAIAAAKNGAEVILLEKLPKIAAKLKATGGGRCNLTNTLSNENFMERFGREGRFMTPALDGFDHNDLQDFFTSIDVPTHALDGFRIFPVGHSSLTIIKALEKEMDRVGVKVICSQRVKNFLFNHERIIGLETQDRTYDADNIILASGGMGYPGMGAEGDGYAFAEAVGHSVTSLHPAMMPLKTKELWGANCRADTIAKVVMKVDIKKHKKLQAKGDLIFTTTGIRGPVVLDFSREITPLLSKYDEVPLLMNLTKGMNEEDIRICFKEEIKKDDNHTVQSVLETLLPTSVVLELCKLVEADPTMAIPKLEGKVRDALIKILAWTPLTVSGHDGFKMAMITRGGVKLKEIDPKTLKSKKIEGLYFCGEVMNLDGPCGGYNLQWAFASGALAGQLNC
jgi:predicted Rossmann fold flavoprotein